MVSVVRVRPFCCVPSDDGEVVYDEGDDSPPADEVARARALFRIERGWLMGGCGALLIYQVKCVIFSAGSGGAIQNAAMSTAASMAAHIRSYKGDDCGAYM